MDLAEPFTEAERVAWAAPEELTGSEWADRHRILSAKVSAEPGAWRTSRTPYLRAIMDAATSGEYEVVTFMKPVQVGGSEATRNILGFWIDQDPSPALIVYPNEKSARETIGERVVPMIESTPRLRQHFTDSKQDVKKDQIELRSMPVYTGWAGSPQSMASRPIRYVILDEVDKFPIFSGREAAPIDLAMARTRTYKHRRVVLIISTPTTRDGAVSMAFDSSPLRLRFHVPCPSCGALQLLTLDGLKWPKPIEDRVELAAMIERDRLAWYECEHCEETIHDGDKTRMLESGEWIPEEGTDEGSRSIAFHISSLYSPWVTFSQFAAEFLRSKGDPAKMMNFANSWLGEPFENQIARMSPNVYAKKAAIGYRRGRVPAWAGAIIATADTQKGPQFWYTVRAWGRGYRSRLIDFGKATSFEDLTRKTLDARYDVEESNATMPVSLLLIDARGGAELDAGIDSNTTDQVYRYSLKHPGRVMPLAGHGGKASPKAAIRTRKVSYSPPGESASPYDVVLRVVDTNYFKDILAARIRDASEMWQIPREVDEDYIRQMSSEHKVAVRKGASLQLRWKPLSKGTANHLWDCETYQMAAAEIARVDILPGEEELRAERIRQKKNEAVEGIEEFVSGERYGGGGGSSWVRGSRRGRGW